VRKPPAFQFYADDFLAGTITMSNEERGLYIALLCIQWSKGFIIKADIDRLAHSMADASQAHVTSKFLPSPGGRLVNPRMESERQKQAEFRENKSNAGKTGALARWQPHKSAIRLPMAKNGSPSPSPSPIKRESKEASPLPLVEVFDAWNKTAEKSGLPVCLLMSDKRRRYLTTRLKEDFFVKNWRAALDKVSKSQFCLGMSERGWRASFDWFITPDAVAKVMEGKYDQATKEAAKEFSGY
jgi:uncharacterized protein YdaU (DUF1376 family)